MMRKAKDILELVREGRADEALRRLAAEADPESATEALRALNHGRRATEALRTGRVDLLRHEALAAGETATAAYPWVQFHTGSLLQAGYRCTADPLLRRRGLQVLRGVADRRDQPELAAAARGLMGNIHMMHGALHTAVDHCDAAIELAAAEGSDPAATAMAHQFRGYVLFEWNRRDEARAALETAWSVTESGNVGVRSGVARLMARVSAASDEPEIARAWIDRLEALLPGSVSLRNREWLAAVRVRHRLDAHGHRRASDWLKTYDYAPESIAGKDPLWILARLHEVDQVLAILEAMGEWEAIRRVAPRVAEVAGHERPWFTARAASAEAVALWALGRWDRADRRMDAALHLGERGSFVRCYLEGDARRGELLRRAAATERPLREAARRVLDAAPELRTRTHARGPLSPTQLAVLEKVAVGRSNKGVAREMGIAVTTVKTHLRAIYDRLDVGSRTEAVARARRDGLI